MNPTTRQLRQTHVRLAAEVERKRVVEEFERSLVEVEVRAVRTKYRRPSLVQRKPEPQAASGKEVAR